MKRYKKIHEIKNIVLYKKSDLLNYLGALQSVLIDAVMSGEDPEDVYNNMSQELRDQCHLTDKKGNVLSDDIYRAEDAMISKFQRKYARQIQQIQDGEYD